MQPSIQFRDAAVQENSNATNTVLFVRGKAVVTLAVGALLLAVPAWFFMWFGLSLDPAAQFLARLFGAVLLGVGAVLFAARDARGLRRFDCRMFALADAMGAVIVALAMSNGLMNVLGWALAATYAGGSLGFAWCARKAAA